MRVLSKPEKVETKDDGTTHYLKSIPEHSDRILRVITNAETEPPQIVTVFFDRRVKGEL